jgi:MFS family permease
MGAIGAGRVADRIGRQRTILITATLFMTGVLAAAFSPAFAFLLAAQVVIGPGVGSASMVVPMYIGEAAPPRFRGALNAITDAGTFFMFAFLTVLALIYFWQRVPETKGLQLADISAGRGRPVGGKRSWRGGRQRTDLAGSSRALAGRARHGRGCRNAGPGP